MITIDTSDYKASHGKNPRGRGSWAFSLGVSPRSSDFDCGSDYVFWTPGSTTYGDALKLARAATRSSATARGAQYGYTAAYAAATAAAARAPVTLTIYVLA